MQFFELQFLELERVCRIRLCFRYLRDFHWNKIILNLETMGFAPKIRHFRMQFNNQKFAP